MSDPVRGEQIFRDLVQYPLADRSKDGIQDYIFYIFKDPSDAYRAEARRFFQKHYPRHVAQDASSLEDMVAKLQNHVTAHHITRIRELVIVAHGAVNQLYLPILNSLSGVDAVYGCLTEYSLSMLQSDFKASKFGGFAQNRKDVLACLLDDSWVTIRACNIGQSARCLYALYSFFGGQANVYAPRRYLFFGHAPIGPGQHIASTFGLYDHLVKQHFLPTNEHTPDRQGTIVTDLVDPGSFSTPFDLATNGDASYQGFRQELSTTTTAKPGSELKAKFMAGGHQLSDAAYIDPRRSQGSAWYILDSDKGEDGKQYVVEYEIRNLASLDGISTLQAAARLRSLTSAADAVSIQMFWSDDDHNDFIGKVVDLAGYEDSGPGSDQRFKDEFDATKTLLDSGTWSSATIDLKVQINNKLGQAPARPMLSDSATITPAGVGSWMIADGATQLKVVLDERQTGDGQKAHVLTVWQVFSDPESFARRQNLVTATRGLAPDSPGPELAAYLDGFSIDDLTAFIDRLRSPYQPMNAYFIHHAQQAMTRKREYSDWWRSQHGDTGGPLGAPLGRYEVLMDNESHDLSSVAYQFEFSNNWEEVKAASRFVTPGSFVTDLFDEEVLHEKLDLSGTWICAGTPDSPSASRDSLRSFEIQGHESYFAWTPDKSVYQFGPPPDDKDCDSFGQALQQWNQLAQSGETPQAIKDALESLKAPDLESLFDKLKEFYEQLHMGSELVELVFDKELLPDLNKILLEHIAEHVSWLADPLAVTGEIMPAIAIPWELWKHDLELNLEAVENAKRQGVRLAVRQWLWELITLTAQTPMPPAISIDLGGPDAYQQRYQDELALEGITDQWAKSYISYSPEDMKAGFAEGAEMMDRIGPEILAKVDEAINEKVSKLGLSPCKLRKLKEAGLLDLDQVRPQMLRNTAHAILDQVPRM